MLSGDGDSDDDDNGSGGSGSPEGIVEEAYTAINNQDAEAFRSTLHSESPERPVQESDIDPQQEEFEVSLQGTSVANDDPSEEDVRNQWEGAAGFSSDDVDTMVNIVTNAGNAAIVEAEAQITAQIQGEERTNTSTETHLTATEGGSWKIVV
jgi:hypothetical protein